MSALGATAASAAEWSAALIRERLAASAPRHDIEDWLVPGLTALQSQHYREFFPRAPLAAAVLVPIVEREVGLTVLLTQRNAGLRHHPGQVSFPGGRLDPPSESPRAAALREAQEEIGLDPACIEVVGYLPDHIVISGFRVTPVVAFVRPPFRLTLQVEEVEDAFEVPLAHLFDPANHRARHRPVSRDPGASEVELCDISFGERRIWGATAGMLMTFYRVCRGEQEGSE